MPPKDNCVNLLAQPAPAQAGVVGFLDVSLIRLPKPPGCRRVLLWISKLQSRPHSSRFVRLASGAFYDAAETNV